MTPIKIVPIVLIVLGTLALIYGGFSYTQETHEAQIGSLEVSVTEEQRVNIPFWGGAGAILIGGILLLVERKRS